MGLGRLFRNEVITLLTQGRTQRAFFDEELSNPRGPAPLTEQEQEYYRQWKFPELGFRNYWYPVVLSKDLTQRPLKRRLLGETLVFWRDAGRAHALADRCPHRGASLAEGHVRFPGSGTISCPYHGWTFDGSGALRACIQEGPESAMPGKVRTKAYPVEERLGVVWVWIGDQAPVPIEEDLPVAMKHPGMVSFIHFTKVWDVKWPLLFDNFIDGIHAPYLHRTSPQFFLRKLPYRTVGVKPHFDFVEHDGKILELAHGAKPGQPKVYQAEFPGLGTFPRRLWWRILDPRRTPRENIVPGFKPRSFLHGLPSYVHTVHEDRYFTQFFVPIDRDHVYNMCAMTWPRKGHTLLTAWWRFYYNVYRLTHDTWFIGQDFRVLRSSTAGRERLSAWDQDVIRWRKFAVENARGFLKKSASSANGVEHADGLASQPAPNSAGSAAVEEARTPALAG